MSVCERQSFLLRGLWPGYFSLTAWYLVLLWTSLVHAFFLSSFGFLQRVPYISSHVILLSLWIFPLKPEWLQPFSYWKLLSVVLSLRLFPFPPSHYWPRIFLNNLIWILPLSNWLICKVGETLACSSLPLPVQLCILTLLKVKVLVSLSAPFKSQCPSHYHTTSLLTDPPPSPLLPTFSDTLPTLSPPHLPQGGLVMQLEHMFFIWTPPYTSVDPLVFIPSAWIHNVILSNHHMTCAFIWIILKKVNGWITLLDKLAQTLSQHCISRTWKCFHVLRFSLSHDGCDCFPGGGSQDCDVWYCAQLSSSCHQHAALSWGHVMLHFI